MTRVQVFDPAPCCDTGVCGEAVDQRLLRFGADLEWLSVTPEDMWSAVTIGQGVKEAPAKAVLTLARRHLRRDESGKMLQVVCEEASESPGGGGCCSSGLPTVKSGGE